MQIFIVICINSNNSLCRKNSKAIEIRLARKCSALKKASAIQEAGRSRNIFLMGSGPYV